MTKVRVTIQSERLAEIRRMVTTSVRLSLSLVPDDHGSPPQSVVSLPRT
jgi:hypothetical protein